MPDPVVPVVVEVTPKHWYNSALFRTGLVFFTGGVLDMLSKFLLDNNLMGKWWADAVLSAGGILVMYLRAKTVVPLVGVEIGKTLK